MPFVKLDCKLLDSSLWPDRDARDVFITCLLLAVPWEITEATPTVSEINGYDDFILPPGFYGLVEASRSSLAARAVMDPGKVQIALMRLMSPDDESRNPAWQGRRLTRVYGKGFVVLNFDTYRSKDHTSAERSRRWRERHKKA